MSDKYGDGVGKVPHSVRRAYTLQYLSEHHEPVFLDWSMCRCDEFDHPHPPHKEEIAKFLVECHGTDKRTKETKNGRRTNTRRKK